MTTKRRFIKHLPLMLAGLAMGLGVFINIPNKPVDSSAIENVSRAASTYYDEITATSGTSLLGQLHDLSKKKHTTYNSYSAISTSNCINTDPYGSNSYVMDFYSGAPTKNEITSSGTVGWNREHVWCQDLSNGLYGTTGAGADIQHLRPTIPKLNSDRGNKKYGELNNSGTASTATDVNNNTVYGGYYSGSVFQPMDNKKGDVARIVMYLYMHYNKASNVGGSSEDNSYFGTLNFTHVISASNEAAAIQLLLTWNTSDPVDSIETTRNEEAAKITGCRNPFIDHPEYANSIWGSSSTDPSATISPSSASVAVNSTVTLTATLTNITSANSITWTSSDASKATVSKGTTSTTSSVATVSGVATGSATIYCKYSGTTIGSATITVTSGGGSGGSSNEYCLYSGSITEGDYLIVYDSKAMNTTISSNRLQYETVTSSNNTITTSNSSIIWHIAPSSTYWTIYNTGVEKYAAGNGTKNQVQLVDQVNDYSKWTVSGTSTYEFVNKNNSDSSVNANLRENGTYGFACYATATGGALSLYKKSGSSSSKTLSSISVYTAPNKTSYTVGQYFDPTGLVIRRNYSDSTHDTYTYADHTSEFTFDPTTTTALATSHTSVTITYGGKDCTQAITVTAPVVTSITASVSKTFYVGETISSSDITVKDNNNNTVSSFTFANDGYQFTYADSNSGGSTKTKTFANSITGAGKTCSLTVNVVRTAYVTPSTEVTDTITASDLAATSTSYTDFSNVSKSSSAKYAGNSAKNNAGAIQMRSNNSNSGIVSTTSGGSVSSVTITVSSGTNTINVYGKNTAYSAASDLYSSSTQGTLVGSTSSTGTITFTTSYAYVGIRSSSGAIYLTSIAIKYGSGETAKNVANYIMYADTNNQCTTKLSIAVGYIKNMSSTEKSTFQTSNDYVISTARTRLEAWATNQGKTINYTSGTLSNASRLVPLGNTENNNRIIMLIIVSMVGVTSIGACLYIRKKRSR